MNITGFAINADAGFLDGNMETMRRELSYYRESGFTHVELSPHGVGVVCNGRLIPQRMAELQAILTDFPFRYTVHGPNTLNLMNLSEPETERHLFLASIEFTRAVQGELLVYHSGRYIPEENFQNPHFQRPTPGEMELMWETEKRLLREMATIAKGFGVRIGLENARPYLDGSPYCYAERLDHLKRMVEEVDRENVGICLDVGHGYLAARFYGFDFLGAISSVAPYVNHVHLHDNYGKASTSYEKKQVEMAAVGRGDMHLPVGWGEIPAAGVMALLKRYCGVVTLEMRPRYRAYFGQALTYARELAGAAALTKVSNL